MASKKKKKHEDDAEAQSSPDEAQASAEAEAGAPRERLQLLPLGDQGGPGLARANEETKLRQNNGHSPASLRSVPSLTWICAAASRPTTRT